MRILILGGTRFLGQQVATILSQSGHELTLLSRRAGNTPPGVTLLCAERRIGLKTLKDNHYDVVLDFICHDDSGPIDVATHVHAHHYILISSTWLPRLWSGDQADEAFPGREKPQTGLPANTLGYLRGKANAERATAVLRDAGRSAVSLRLPIMLGAGDHTGRLNFYRQRFADGHPLISVNGGNNLAHIADVNNLATTIVKWILTTDINRFPIWEGLPGAAMLVSTLLKRLAHAAGVTPAWVNISAHELELTFPRYVTDEPFWRETPLAPTAANIFTTLGTIPHVYDFCPPWITGTGVSNDNLRSQEIYFLAHRSTH